MNIYDPSSDGGSTSTHALRLQSLSNVGEPGLWVFRVDEGDILSGGIARWIHVCIYLMNIYFQHCIIGILYLHEQVVVTTFQMLMSAFLRMLYYVMRMQNAIMR